MILWKTPGVGSRSKGFLTTQRITGNSLPLLASGPAASCDKVRWLEVAAIFSTVVTADLFLKVIEHLQA